MVYDLMREIDILEKIKSGEKQLDREIDLRKKKLKEIEKDEQSYGEEQYNNIWEKKEDWSLYYKNRYRRSRKN